VPPDEQTRTDRVVDAIGRSAEAIGKRLRSTSARTILAIGWLGLVLYAYPGYMSYDSVLQLTEARSGAYSDVQPPAMAWLWHKVDFVIPGPFGMLVLQSTCLLAGAYLLLRSFMPVRAAAIAASLLLWFPAVAGVMAVIWKDSQMAGYLLLGAGLVLAQRRGVKLAGLVILLLGMTLVRHAFVITLPLVVLLFVWNAKHAWWQRYAIAIAAWLAIALCAQLANRVLARAPQTAASTQAIDRVAAFRGALHLDHEPGSSAVYIWFTDVQDLLGSAKRIDHNSSPSALQATLQRWMTWLGTTWLFKPYMYLVLALALLPLCFRDRTLLAIVASGILGEAALFYFAPGPDFRHSLWLVIATMLTTMIAIARRAGVKPGVSDDVRPA
jgi:hypothetical protein